MFNKSSSEDEYKDYFELRGWGNSNICEHFWYYDELRSKLSLQKGQKVLEIGFGDGRFLEWCRSRELISFGVELLEAAISKARALNHEVFLGPFTSSTLRAGQIFDLIVAFDVVEHLTVSEIRQLLRDTLHHLTLGGRYVFRFPNGNSPFVGPTQSGDITHRTLVSPGTIESIAKPLGLTVERAFNDRMLPPGALSRAKRRLVYGMRGAIETVIGLAYFGRPMPLDPNVFVVVTRSI